MPVAWEPLSKLLYTQTGSDSLAQVIGAVEAVKWDEPEVFRAFQTVTRLWGVPMSDGSVEWWAEVMPAQWTGRTAFYGKLKLASRGETAEVLNFYLTAEMNAEDAQNWARTLSSYWYPTLNTDLEPHSAGAPWEAKADCRPFAVMRGNPMGKPMWIAFDVPAFRLTDEAKALAPRTRKPRSSARRSKRRLRNSRRNRTPGRLREHRPQRPSSGSAAMQTTCLQTR